MSRAHAEIAHQIARLGLLLDDIGDQDPDEADLADLRSVLYGLDAILRLHTTQDETYLSLGDTAEEPTLSAGAWRRPLTAGRAMAHHIETEWLRSMAVSGH